MAGCVLRDLRPGPPTAVQPVFASDDEALAAAIETYERYLVVDAEIIADGGADADRVLAVVTDSYGLDLLAEYRRMRAAGERFTGAMMLASSHLLDIDRDRTRLTVAVCIDISALRLVDESGEEVAFQSEDLVPLAVAFRTANAARIRIDGSELWDGEPVC
jgi:hypothetical protein